MKFIGRNDELRMLEGFYKSSGAELFVLYGRRRVGKSELLTTFCRNKPAIYFTASQVETRHNLIQFTETARQALDDPAMAGVTFQDIEAALTYLANKNKERRLIIVLDEFPYWIDSDKSIPSKLQRFWDNTGKHSNIMLVLCGSSISMMVDHVLAEKSPLYGRRSGQLELEPFDYRTASQFFPKWIPRDQLIVYGVLGGIPAYLAQFDSSISLAENINHKILTKGSFLSEEAEFLLKTELRDPKVYASLLRIIAAGNTSLKDLTSKMDMDSRALATYLSNLQMLFLINREVSMLETAPEKSRKGRYTIKDNFLNFWFHFIEPNITYLETRRGETLYRELISKNISSYMGSIFENICRQYILYYGQELGLPHPQRIGKIWSKDYDLDVVARTHDGKYIFGECKWSSKAINPGLITILIDRAKQSGLPQKDAQHILFSSSGFRQIPEAVNSVKYVSTRELLIPGL